MNYMFMDYWYFVKVTDVEQGKGNQGLGLPKDLHQGQESVGLEKPRLKTNFASFKEQCYKIYLLLSLLFSCFPIHWYLI